MVHLSPLLGEHSSESLMIVGKESYTQDVRGMRIREEKRCSYVQTKFVTVHSSEVRTGGKGGSCPVRTYSRRVATRVAMGL